MQPATRLPPQLTMGSVEVTAVPQRPIFLPVDLHAEWDVAIRARSNVLLVGSASTTEAMLVAMRPGGWFKADFVRGPMCPLFTLVRRRHGSPRSFSGETAVVTSLRDLTASEQVG